MMGRQSDQIQMVILDIDSMIPEDHLLRQIEYSVASEPLNPLQRAIHSER